MAVPISNWSGQWIDFQKLLPYIDWFNAMAYDIHGSWTSHAGHNAPLYAPSTDYDGSAHQGIQYLNITRGVPKNKLVLGVPFYGKRFAASAMYGAQTGVQDVTYAEIAPAIQSSGWTYTWDSVSMVPFLTNNSKTAVITFDDSTSLTTKCQYVKDNGLSGMMIWALGQDVLSGKQPLLEAIGLALNNVTHVHSVHDSELPDFILFDNVPNPFNPTTTISFQIPHSGSSHSVMVSLKVYDILGRELVTLVNEELPSGRYSIPWNASSFSNGVYLYRLTAGSFNQTKRMVLVK
jgi:chitinase